MLGVSILFFDHTPIMQSRLFVFEAAHSVVYQQITERYKLNLSKHQYLPQTYHTPNLYLHYLLPSVAVCKSTCCLRKLDCIVHLQLYRFPASSAVACRNLRADIVVLSSCSSTQNAYDTVCV